MWVITITTNEWDGHDYTEVVQRHLTTSRPKVIPDGGMTGPLFYRIETDRETSVLRSGRVSSIRVREYGGDGPPPPPGVLPGVPSELWIEGEDEG